MTFPGMTNWNLRMKENTEFSFSLGYKYVFVFFKKTGLGGSLLEKYFLWWGSKIVMDWDSNLQKFLRNLNPMIGVSIHFSSWGSLEEQKKKDFNSWLFSIF